jgi:hypothetical protein
MAKIRGIEGLAYDQIQMELRAGARFVEYPYCISVGFISFRRASDIYFIRHGRGAVSRRLGYSVISSLFGWWGIPWGPFCTIASILTSFRGGRDVTEQVLADLDQPAS